MPPAVSPWRLAWAEVGATSGTLTAAIVGVFTSSFGFGALARANDLSLTLATVASATIWAMPGQVALIDSYAKGDGALVIILAVTLANARFLPMTTSMGVMLGMGGRFRLSYLWHAHLMSMVSWAQIMALRDRLTLDLRIPYFAIFASIAYAGALVATAAGHVAAGLLPKPIAVALFISPPVFLLLVMSRSTDRLSRLSFGLGILSVLLLEAAIPGWGLILGGLAGGTLAFVLDRLLEARHGG